MLRPELLRELEVGSILQYLSVKDAHPLEAIVR